MLYKGFDLGFKDADTKQGIVSGYFAVFGNKDHDGDIIEKGAFAKTINERGPKGKGLIKYLLDHDSKKVVAKINELREDEKGLYYEAKIGSHSLGKDFMAMIESELINQHSFGFKVIKEQYDNDKKANMLKELFMYEGSAVQFLGANPDTTFIELKNSDYINYLDRLEKFIRTTDATDETIIQLETKLKSLLEMFKPSPDTLSIEKADRINTAIKNLSFESWEK